MVKELIGALSIDELPWDIPVLKMKSQTRRQLFEQTIEQAQNTGFVLPVTTGLILAWKDILETSWLGSLAIRAWTCCSAPLTGSDLTRFSAKLAEFDVGFAAVSGWMPFPKCEGLLDTGASVHAAVEGMRQRERLDDENNHVEAHLLGAVPEHWVVRIVNHVGETAWRDRHAKDYRLDRKKVKHRRTSWIEAQLREGDGFFVAVLNMHGDLGAYLVVPLDRSRQRFDGPVVAGINAVAGSIYEGGGFARTAILEGFRVARSMGTIVITQFQPENMPMAHMVRNLFLARYCTRYDLHWHGDWTDIIPDYGEIWHQSVTSVAV